MKCTKSGIFVKIAVMWVNKQCYCFVYITNHVGCVTAPLQTKRETQQLDTQITQHDKHTTQITVIFKTTGYLGKWCQSSCCFVFLFHLLVNSHLPWHYAENSLAISAAESLGASQTNRADCKYLCLERWVETGAKFGVMLKRKRKSHWRPAWA